MDCRKKLIILQPNKKTNEVGKFDSYVKKKIIGNEQNFNASSQFELRFYSS